MMLGFMDGLISVNSVVNSLVWGPYMLALLVGTGVYITLRTGFFQVRKFGFSMRNTMGKLFGGRASKADDKNISAFQAVSTALASTVGTGNVVGVATAITLGGPGAVFWMWVSAFFGMMTKYAEIVLAIKYRETNAWGQHVGGPMYYIKNGLNLPWLASLFAVFAFLASFGIGNMTQANSIASSVQTSFNVPPMITGGVLVVVVTVVIIGGIKSIASVTEKLVPFMAVLYVALSLALLATNATHIPEAFSLIFSHAFGFGEVAGGVSGYTIAMAMRYGVARGVFSNEAGLGSAPMAHAASSTKEPVEQGLWGIFEVFVDTIIICTMTALVILSTGVWDSGAEGAALTIAAFNHGLPGTIGGIGLTIGLGLFAFSTILGWSYYGEKALEYLFRKTQVTRYAILAYRVAFVAAVFAGSIGGLKLVWDIADTLNGLMALPNLIGVLLLSGVVFKETRSYLERHKSGDLDE